MSKPIQQVKVGDTVTKGGFLGFFETEMKVIDIDDERGYAFVCDRKLDALFIMNFKLTNNIPPGHSITADCSCSEFEDAGINGKRLAFGM